MSDEHLDADTLQQLLDGELAPDVSLVAKAHLADCHVCSTLAESMAATLGVEGQFSAERPGGLPVSIGRYQIRNEIARGGMGVVASCFDGDFQRTLAIKVSLDETCDEAVTQRFWEEARITGRLQHPGIPPVHDLGRLDDGRPYFVMKLIAGRTLHDILRERSDPSLDLPNLISIFEQVCQTLAYAHTEETIHRDLKPQNIMVGAFGEVQVMDWGLGKVLSEPNGADTSRKRSSLAEHSTSDEPGGTDRSDDRDLTRDGSIMGTPAYISPEQAQGDVGNVDKASDVFGLGAILCQILTGQPPYRGQTPMEVLASASRGDTKQVVERLNDCGADQPLIHLTCQCLATDRSQRPADASVVAKRIHEYREQVAERLRQTELKQAQAEVQIHEERKRRRLWLSLAGLALVLVCGLAGGALWYQNLQAQRAADAALQQQQETARRDRISGEVDAALGEAEEWQRQLHEKLADRRSAAALLSTLDEWERLINAAAASLKRAEKVAEADLQLLMQESRQRLESVQNTFAEDARDWELVQRLDRIRSDALGDASGSEAAAYAVACDQYASVFSERGLNPLGLSDQERTKVASKVQESRVVHAILAALDHWAGSEIKKISEALILFRQGVGSTPPKVKQIRTRMDQIQRLAKLVDPDPWRDQVRDINLWFSRDRSNVKLTANVDIASESPQLLDVVASLDAANEIPFRRRVLLHHPSDFYLCFSLSRILPISDERTGLLHAALAARPRSARAWSELCFVLSEQGKPELALLASDRALEMRPGLRDALANRGVALFAARRINEAIQVFDQVLDEFGAERDLDQRGYAAVLSNKAAALMAMRRPAEAAREFEKAIAAYPEFANAHSNLGVAYSLLGEWTKAEEACRKGMELEPRNADNLAYVYRRHAIALLKEGVSGRALQLLQKSNKLIPDSVSTQLEMGRCYVRIGKTETALNWFQSAAKLEPGNARAAYLVGETLTRLEKRQEAINALQKCLQIDASVSRAHYVIGVNQVELGQVEESIRSYRRATELDPQYGEAFFNLGTMLLKTGRFSESVAALKRSSRLLPRDADSLRHLGKALEGLDRYEEAEAAYQRAKALGSNDAKLELASVLLEQNKYAEAEVEFRKLVEQGMELKTAFSGLGESLFMQRKYQKSIEVLEELLELDPRHLTALRFTGGANLRLGREDAALAAFRKILEVEPDNQLALHESATILLRRPGDGMKEAIKNLEKVVKQLPNDARVVFNLGAARLNSGHYPQAEEQFRRAIKLQPNHLAAYDALGTALIAQDEFAEATKVFRQALKRNPDFAPAYVGLGTSLRGERQLAASLEALEKADQLKPGDPKITRQLGMVTRWTKFEKTFTDLNSGAKKLDGPDDWIAFADYCLFYRRDYAAGQRAFTLAFGSDAASVKETTVKNKSGNLFNAACSAILTAEGKAQPPAQLTAEKKVQLRHVALVWLQAAVDELKKRPRFDSGDSARQQARIWFADDDLDRVREPGSLKSLPEAEQEKWKALWAEIERIAQPPK